MRVRIGSFVIAAAFLPLLACAPRSIVQAVAKNPDTFPKPYTAVSPITSGTRGGSMGSINDKDVFVADAVECFKVTATTKTTGTPISVKYGRSGVSKLELDLLKGSISKALGDIGIAASVDFARETVFATGTISNETVFLVPNPFGECKFEDPKRRYEVVRQQARAADLSFSSEVNVTTNAGVEVPIQKLLDVGVKTGWSFNSDRKLTGKDVVVAVKREPILVEISRETKSISTPPKIGVDLVRTLGFSSRLLPDVQLIFRGSQMTEPGVPSITLMPNSSMPFVGVPSEDFKDKECSMGKENTLKVGEACFFVPPPGVALFAVRWAKGVDPTSGGDTIEVSITSYATVDPNR